MSVTIDEDPLEELEAGAFPGERRRQITNLLMHAVLLLVMVATVGVLAWVLVYVAGQGLKYLGPEFLTQTPPGNPGQRGVPQRHHRKPHRYRHRDAAVDARRYRGSDLPGRIRRPTGPGDAFSH
jgi:hypothetical protein